MLHSRQIAAAVEDSGNHCKQIIGRTLMLFAPLHRPSNYATAALFFLLLAAAPVSAQDWPAKTVRIVVPFGAGSTPDIVARLVADGLQQKYPASTFVVENKPGASGNLGTDTVAKAAPDGSTIGVSIGGPLAINTLLFAKLPYDPHKDIAPITQLVTQPSILAVSPNLGVNSVPELVALLKKNPGKYNFASIGNGSLSHLAMEAIAIKGGAQLVHVPYTSSPQAVTAVIRNDAQMACLPAIAVTPHAKSGAVKILAVSTAHRSPYLPEVPTLKESGIDVEADAWNGLIAPGGTPKSIIDKISRDVSGIIKEPAVREKLATQLMEPVGSSPEELRARMDGEIARWAPVIKAANVKIN
jgi:tripartite-type tricarboxylate transporter receptor subunit TctC